MNDTRPVRSESISAQPGAVVRFRSSKVFAVLGMALVVDQMLLPMFHPLGFPFKPSYLILMMMPLLWAASLTGGGLAVSGRGRMLWRIMGPLAGIGMLGLLGELYLRTFVQPESYYDAGKQLAAYAFMVLAFGLGQRSRGFRLDWLVWMLYGLISIILLLSLAGDRVPWLAQLWWKSEDEIANRLALNASRPVPFGDGSMVAANILLLFIVAASRFRLVRLGWPHIVAVSGSVLFTALLLQSRNQIVASIILLTALALSAMNQRRRNVIGVIVLSVSVTLAFTILEGPIRASVPAMDIAFKRIQSTELLATADYARSESILRPLLHMQRSADRWAVSPVIGTGFSVVSTYPFDRINFHNDWLYVLVTSGTLGGLLLVLWAFRIYRVLGLLVLLPLALPGLTNSFLFHVSGVIVYSFMLGLLIEERRLARLKGAMRTCPPNAQLDGRGSPDLSGSVPEVV